MAAYKQFGYELPTANQFLNAGSVALLSTHTTSIVSSVPPLPHSSPASVAATATTSALLISPTASSVGSRECASESGSSSDSVVDTGGTLTPDGSSQAALLAVPTPTSNGSNPLHISGGIEHTHSPICPPPVKAALDVTASVGIASGAGNGSAFVSCCDDGKPMTIDPVTGRLECSCQCEPNRLAALTSYTRMQTAATVNVGVYSSPYTPSNHQNPYPSIGVDSSPFYTSLSNPYALKDGSCTTADITTWSPASMQSGPTSYYTYDPTFGGYGYGAASNYDLSSRRKNATRESTATLKAWLSEHKKNPYPTKGEKIMLAIITKMTLTQVSTWFANARRRLKKENKVTWEPKSRNEDDDDDDMVLSPSEDVKEHRRDHHDHHSHHIQHHDQHHHPAHLQALQHQPDHQPEHQHQQQQQQQHQHSNNNCRSGNNRDEVVAAEQRMNIINGASMLPSANGAGNTRSITGEMHRPAPRTLPSPQQPPTQTVPTALSVNSGNGSASNTMARDVGGIEVSPIIGSHNVGTATMACMGMGVQGAAPPKDPFDYYQLYPPAFKSIYQLPPQHQQQHVPQAQASPAPPPPPHPPPPAPLPALPPHPPPVAASSSSRTDDVQRHFTYQIPASELQLSRAVEDEAESGSLSSRPKIWSLADTAAELKDRNSCNSMSAAQSRYYHQQGSTGRAPLLMKSVDTPSAVDAKNFMSPATGPTPLPLPLQPPNPAAPIQQAPPPPAAVGRLIYAPTGIPPDISYASHDGTRALAPADALAMASGAGASTYCRADQFCT